MATANHVLLQRITLTASAASITFSSIPQTGYTDLKLVISSRDTNTGSYWSNIAMTFNGTSTGYSSRIVANADGSAVSATGGSTGITYAYSVAPSATANTFANSEIYIPNYTSSNYKSVSIDSVTENNGTQVLLGLSAGLWSNTAAITSITLTPANSASFVQYSSFSLYGIANASTNPTISPKAFGGDIIKTDGTYWYHAFLSSGLFTPQLNITADVLVVAGGGGGGNFGGGGGGAGGLLGFTSQALANATSYICAVGSGGAGAAANSALSGTEGGNSRFASLTTCIGGGRGGGRATTTPGSVGGSGGGNAYSLGTVAGTSGQGYAGGSGTANGGGGGGGAGEAGNTDAGQGAGGDGVSTYSSWGSAVDVGQNISGTYWFAGGGGGWGDNAVGGSGGDGGGGAGSSSSTPSGTAGTGGGGGATSQSIAAGNGGSGVIIIRYPV